MHACMLGLHPGKKQLLQQRKQQAESQSLIIVLQLRLNIVNYGTIVLSFFKELTGPTFSLNDLFD